MNAILTALLAALTEALRVYRQRMAEHAKYKVPDLVAEREERAGGSTPATPPGPASSAEKKL
jgi:hypothetical protein